MLKFLKFFVSKLLILFLFSAICFVHSDSPCIAQDFEKGSCVCVCNSTYCDTIQPLEKVESGKYFHVTSSKEGKRFQVTDGQVLDKSSDYFVADIEVKVTRSKRYQRIIGFGGAFTDAAGINIASLSEPLQKTIINLYYGKTGLEYNIGRVPMAGTDFSTHAYSYDDESINDVTLRNFSLAEEDLKYKIPYIKEAVEMNPKLKLFASPWSSPPWMKTNNDYVGRGFLRKEYYQVWANYFVKFFDEYSKHDLTFWGVTTQNEPTDGIIGFPLSSIGWTPSQQRDWIKRNLGPTLAASNHSHVKIMILDDQRYFLQLYTNTILKDAEASKYVSGVGLHWYGDPVTPPELLDLAHYTHPDKFLLATEACEGSIPGQPDHVSLGSWDRAVRYASDIITDLNHFICGWVDWNLVLDMQGGPNFINNFVDSPIIADSSADVIYKQPMYYALGHFSKYIPEHSQRIKSEKNTKGNDLEVLAVHRPDGALSLVLLNRKEETQNVRIIDSESKILEVNIDPLSINTIVYN